MAAINRLFEIYPAGHRAAVPLGLRVNDLVLATGLSAAIGREAAGDVDEQMAVALRRLYSVLTTAGLAFEDVRRVVAYLAPGADREDLSLPWQAAFSQHLRGPSLEVRQMPLPGGQLVRLDAFARSDSGKRRDWPPDEIEWFDELFLTAEKTGMPGGFRLGPLLYAPSISGAGRQGGEIPDRDTESQLRGALSNMDAFLAAGGSRRGEVGRVTFFMRDVLERPLLNKVWAEWFPDPDDRPPHKYVPAALPAGENVRLQVLALPGADRRVLEIPGVTHGDPMSMGVRIGNAVLSSRIIGGAATRREPAMSTEEQLGVLWEHARALMSQAGGELANLAQATVFIGDLAMQPAVDTFFRRATAGFAVTPRLNLIVAALGTGPVPRLEIIGLV